MASVDDFKELMAEISEGALFLNDFDDTIVGYSERAGGVPVVAYNRNAIIEKLMEKDGLSFEDATDHFDYNIIGGWMGEGTPLFITSLEDL